MLTPNPFLGVCCHWLGGFAAGSFYVSFKGVRRWSWETYWLTGQVFSSLIFPLALSLLLTNQLGTVLRQQSLSTLGWTYFFGVLWGFGGLTFGLTMRYLGLSLGTGVALGYCAIFGTLLPPIIKEYFPQVPSAESFSQIALSTPGRITLAGVALCLVGILLAAAAGLAKEKHLPPAEKEKTIAEFSFSKGMLVATFCGIMSACFAFGLTAGNPINDASLAAGTTRLWTGLPKLVVVLLGGLTTNVVCCVVLNIRNRSAQQYYAANQQTPLLRNYLFSALAGATCYLQFLFYTMGETQMGKFSFASWTLHMASIIIFATIWGWVYHEWKGSGGKAHALIGVGLAILVLSTIVIGWGTFLKVQGGPN